MDHNGTHAIPRSLGRPFLFLMALVLLASAADGTCVVKNKSAQPVVIMPVVGVAVEVVVEVGASVVLKPAQQYCYFKNMKSGHKKGPVKLASDGIYAIVDGDIPGEVKVCVATTLLGGILEIGGAIVVGL